MILGSLLTTYAGRQNTRQYTVDRSSSRQHTMPHRPTTQLLSRAIFSDNKLNIIIDVLTTVIGVLSAILGWTIWGLTNNRMRRSGQLSMLVLELLLQVYHPFEYVIIMSPLNDEALR